MKAVPQFRPESGVGFRRKFYPECLSANNHNHWGWLMKTIMTVFFLVCVGWLSIAATAEARMVKVEYLEEVSDAETQYLTSINLEEVIGRGGAITRDFSSDLSSIQLESVIGWGFISKLTPEEIGRIDAQGFLPSPEELMRMTRDLVEITIKGVKIVIDKSRYTQKELVAVVEGWERFLQST